MVPICEFSGVSGCGKSTLIDKLMDEKDLCIITDSQLGAVRIFGLLTLKFVRYIPSKLFSVCTHLNRIFYKQLYVNEANTFSSKTIEQELC